MLNTAKSVAKYIINRLNSKNIEITHLKLQKLLYFCQKEYLQKYNKPLFEEDFEAWVHGPVLPEIYREYAKYGWDNIPKTLRTSIIFTTEKNHIKEVLEKYQNLSGKELEILSHNEYSWILARKGVLFYAPSNSIITKESIRQS